MKNLSIYDLGILLEQNGNQVAGLGRQLQRRGGNDRAKRLAKRALQEAQTILEAAQALFNQANALPADENS